MIIKKTISKVKKNSFKLLPSSTFAKIYFKKNYLYSFDLDNPVTFNEKLWWLHIFNRDPLSTVCTDKVLVRDYVSKCGLEHILNEVYAVYNQPEDIKLELLPNEFFLKCNHLSDGNIWCKDKSEFPINEVKKKLKKLIRKNYYWNSREWNYKNIEPKILCEKVLKDKDSTIGLVDYRFFCFDGKAEFLAVDIETTSADGSHFAGAKRNLYDLEFNNLNIQLRRPNFDESIVKKPGNFDTMIEYAEKLASPFVACRVDFYNIDGKIIFGEITFHQGGSHDITPSKYQHSWGELINLKSDKLIVSKQTKKRYSKLLS